MPDKKQIVYEVDGKQVDANGKEIKGDAQVGQNATLADSQAQSDGGADTGEQTGGNVNLYASWNKDTLQEEVDRLGLEVQGTGEGGRVKKDDLIQAIQQHNVQQQGGGQG